jgi:hypothetical protein
MEGEVTQPFYVLYKNVPIHFQNKYQLMSLNSDNRTGVASGEYFTTKDQDNDDWIDGNKKLFPKFYLFHLYLFFQKEIALSFTLEDGGSMGKTN